MTETVISDIIVPEVFAKYMMRETAEKARIFQSGILQNNGVIANFLAGGGQTVQLPHWTDLSGTENISSDDPASLATPLNVDATKDIAIRHNRNQGWGSADLVEAFAGDDPLAMVSARVSTYWANQMEKMFISTVQGVIADNVANDSGDMVHTAAGTITAEDVLDAAQTMGDMSDQLAVIMMHSRVYVQLAKLNLIDFIPDARGEVRFPTYLGYQVIRDDDCFIDVGATPDAAHSYLVTRDAFAWGESSARVPVEIDRAPRGGDGGGVEELWTRRQFCLHPYGFQWLSGSMVGQSPTNAELILAANWDRVAPERKQVGIACLISDLVGG